MWRHRDRECSTTISSSEPRDHQVDALRGSKRAEGGDRACSRHSEFTGRVGELQKSSSGSCCCSLDAGERGTGCYFAKKIISVGSVCKFDTDLARD